MVCCLFQTTVILCKCSLRIVPQKANYRRNVVATLDFHGDQVEFADAARQHITKHATKTRADWRSELLHI